MNNIFKNSIFALVAAVLALSASFAQAQAANAIYVTDTAGTGRHQWIWLCAGIPAHGLRAAAATDPNGCKCDKDLIPKEVCEKTAAARSCCRCSCCRWRQTGWRKDHRRC